MSPGTQWNRYDQVIKVSLLGIKSCLPLISITYTHQMICSRSNSSNLVQNLAPFKGFKSRVNKWNGVFIFNSDFNQCLKIYTRFENLIFLLNKILPPRKDEQIMLADRDSMIYFSMAFCLGRDKLHGLLEHSGRRLMVQS